MKKIILFLNLVISYSVQSQHTTLIDFETPTIDISIDTSNPNNIWQIGKPQKSVFDTAYSGMNAIVTDTINPYPPQNISQFVVSVDLYAGPGPIVSFYHKMDTRSNRDGGYIEISEDSINWYLLSDSINSNDWNSYHNNNYMLFAPDFAYNYYRKDSLQKDTLYNGHLGFSGTFGWTEVKLYFRCMALKRPFQNWLRFTFVSDTGLINQDGWMIDSFTVQNGGTPCTWINDENIRYTISPNPATATLHLAIEQHGQYEVVFYNLMGQKMYSQPIANDAEIIDVRDWMKGIYFYQLLENGKQVGSGKVLKE